MNIQRIEVAGGKTLVVLPEADYQDLIDARDHAVAMAAIAAGADTLTEAEARDYLASPTPLAFWRRHRGQTQEELASAAGISQPYLAQLEKGKRLGDVMLYAKLAASLRLHIEDIVPG